MNRTFIPPSSSSFSSLALVLDLPSTVLGLHLVEDEDEDENEDDVPCP
jgi:hypothetical protein